jgi:pimeloyl-ACP methyl ester carboxylesterase
MDAMRRSSLFLLVLSAPLLAEDLPDRLRALFTYDASLPRQTRLERILEDHGAKLSELTYASPMGGSVNGYLVEPIAPGRNRAGVVFGHWGPGNRSEFVPEAMVYARAGAVCVLVNYPWTRAADSRRSLKFEDGAKDLEIARQAVIDLRRAIDLLRAREDVDPDRIAYIGHSYGAQWGAILSAIDKRLKTCVLVGGVASAADLWERNNEPEMVELRKQWPADKRSAYMVSYTQLDAIRYVPFAAPVTLYFQFARFERYFDEQSMNAYFAAASQPKLVSWYPTGHDLNDPLAWADRARWLERSIGLRDVLRHLQERLR